MRWFEKIKTFNPWSLIGGLSVGISIFYQLQKVSIVKEYLLGF
tara:strand:- start:569 stop:697 length:129 start_codon:yes stop_codon:yes gene_type:complete